jgi:hypothetical protein
MHCSCGKYEPRLTHNTAQMPVTVCVNCSLFPPLYIPAPMANHKPMSEIYKEFLVKENPCADKHYDFTYKLTKEDIEKGEIRIDPYFVSMQWRLGEKDPSGCGFHILKTLARLFTKEGNSKAREINSIQLTANRMMEVHNEH